MALHAQLRDIVPNDHVDWDAFVRAARPDPWDDYGWFSLELGPEGDPGTEIFQVLVATPAAVSRAKGDRACFRGIIVEYFDPDTVSKTLHEHVAAIAAITGLR